MKKWKCSGKNRWELCLLDVPVCVLRYAGEYGYTCQASVDGAILDKTFGHCSYGEAVTDTEIWYTGVLARSIRMHNECVENCVKQLRELKVV